MLIDKSRIKSALDKIRKINLISDDMQYKKQFSRVDKQNIYDNHVKMDYISCAFCSNLTRSYCHAHCLKCGIGSYIHCSPLLPGLMYYDKKNPDESDYLSVPWLYKKPCKSFIRLEIKNYLNNFKVPFSWLTVYNYEILEGLVYGLSAKERPCHICATIDYSIFKICSGREDFEKNTPCPYINILMEAIYKTG